MQEDNKKIPLNMTQHYEHNEAATTASIQHKTTVTFIQFILVCTIFVIGQALSMSTNSSSVSASPSQGLAINRRPPNVIIVGGSSGMGKACAMTTVQHGGRVLLISRSADKLAKAREEIISTCGILDPSIVTTAVLDATDEDAVRSFASSSSHFQTDEANNEEHQHHPQWDGLVYTAAGRAPHGPITSLPTSDTRSILDSKFWGAYYCAKFLSQKLRDGGAIVFTAGVLNRRPGMNCVPLAITNGALEGMTRALALEFGPRLRVNCLSPGFCDTERFDHMDAQMKEAMLRNTADSLPLKRVGTPQDMGEALYYLLTARFCTGVVLDVDGGHGIRQYANPSTDPMRTSTS